MKNEHYSSCDGEITIIIRERTGYTHPIVIAREDFAAVDAVRGTWCLLRRKNGSFYVYCKDYAHGRAKGENGKGRTVYMHRLVKGLRFGDGLVANHLNWNTADCRSKNLEVVTQAINNGHRHLTHTPNSNSTTGFRNIQHRGDKFMVVVASRYVGIFASLADAKTAASAARRAHNERKLAEAQARNGKADYATRMSACSERLAAVQMRKVAA